jgi:hypothetical protein
MKITLLLSLAIFLTPWLQAFAGSEHSGGADTYSPAPAFFLSTDANKSIRICYETSKEFEKQLSDDFLEQSIRVAFQKWGNYIQAKDLFYASWNPGSTAIISKIESITKGCSRNEDLSFYFGVTNKIVKHFRPLYFNPYAFTDIISNGSSSWSRGIVWFSNPGEVDPKQGLPVWGKKAIGSQQIDNGGFLVTLIHEIGHVFGNGHVENTIMSARISNSLERWTGTDPGENPSAADLEIDQSKDLIMNYNLAETFKFSGEIDQSAGLNLAFKKIFGLAPTNPLVVTATRAENPKRRLHGQPDDISHGLSDLVLNFQDGSKTYTATIKLAEMEVKTSDEAPLFNGQFDNHYESAGMSLSGDLYANGQKLFPVIVNYNVSLSLEIKTIRAAPSDSFRIITND